MEENDRRLIRKLIFVLRRLGSKYSASSGKIGALLIRTANALATGILEEDRKQSKQTKQA